MLKVAEEIINQMDLTDTYRIFHLNTKEYAFFLVTEGTFTKIDDLLGNKTSINRYNKMEITPCILSDCQDLKLDINNN